MSSLLSFINAKPKQSLREMAEPYMNEKLDWLEIAKTDPQIGLWYSSLQASYPELRNVPIDLYLKKEQEYFKGGEGFGYDTKSAIEMGHRPEMVEDYTYHWIGQDPKTGYYFKGKQHPTRWMSEQDNWEEQQQ